MSSEHLSFSVAVELVVNDGQARRATLPLQFMNMFNGAHITFEVLDTGISKGSLKAGGNKAADSLNISIYELQGFKEVELSQGVEEIVVRRRR